MLLVELTFSTEYSVTASRNTLHFQHMT